MATLDQSVLQLAAHLHCQRLDQGPDSADFASVQQQRGAAESPFAEQPSSCSGGDVTSDNSSFEHSVNDGQVALNPGLRQFSQPQTDARVSIDGQPKSSQICFDYTKGLCTRGDKCKYSHDLATIVHFNSKEKGICFDYLRNQCHRGLLCRFSHDLSNIAQQCQANEPPRPAQISRASSRRRDEEPDQSVNGDLAGKGKTTAICYDFVKGVCQRGTDCRYSHDLSLIARTARGGQQTQKTGEICYDYLRGRCNRGTSCKYSHNISFLATPAFLTNALNPAGTNGTTGANGTDAASLAQSLTAGLPHGGVNGSTSAPQQRLATSLSAADTLARAASSTSPASLHAALTSSLTSNSISPDLEGRHPLNASLSQDLPDIQDPTTAGWRNNALGASTLAQAQAMAAAAAVRNRQLAAQMSSYSQLHHAAQMAAAAQMAHLLPPASFSASNFAAAAAQQQALASSIAAQRAFMQSNDGTGPGTLHRAQSAPLGPLQLPGVPAVAESLNALLANLGDNPQLLADTLTGLAAAAQAQVQSNLRMSASGLPGQGGMALNSPGQSQPQPIPGRFDNNNGGSSPPLGSYPQAGGPDQGNFANGVNMLAPSASVPGPDQLSRVNQAQAQAMAAANGAPINPDLLPFLKQIWDK